MRYDEQAEEAIAGLLSNRRTTTVTDCWIATCDNGSFQVGRNACHAGIFHLGKVTSGVKYVINGIQKEGIRNDERVTDESAIAYLDYLFNQSPMSKSFVTKSGKQAWEEGYIVSTADCPANIMAIGMIAIRGITQSPARHKQWYDMVQLGVNLDLAMLTSFCSNFSVDDKAHLSASSDDTALYAKMISKSFVKNFLAHKNVVNNKDYRDIGTYSNLNYTWGENSDKGDNSLYETVRKLLDKSKIDNTNTLDIFKKARNASSSTPKYSNYIPLISEYLINNEESLKEGKVVAC